MAPATTTTTTAAAAVATTVNERTPLEWLRVHHAAAQRRDAAYALLEDVQPRDERYADAARALRFNTSMTAREFSLLAQTPLMRELVVPLYAEIARERDGAPKRARQDFGEASHILSLIV